MRRKEVAFYSERDYIIDASTAIEAGFISPARRDALRLRIVFPQNLKEKEKIVCSLREAGISIRQGVAAPTAGSIFYAERTMEMKERKTNRVYSAWDMESILDGFAREVIKSAESVIPDTFTLIDLLGQIHDIRSNCFERFLDDETRRRAADKNDVESENNPRPAQWDDFSESELADAVEMLLKPDEMRRHAACVALFTAYGITPDTVRLTLAERRGDDKKKLA